MVIKILILSLLFICGCSPIAQVKGGYGAPWAFGDTIDHASGRPFRTFPASLAIGLNTGTIGSVDTQGFIGTLFAHTDGEEPDFLAAIVSPRILLNYWSIKPFINVNLGVGSFLGEAPKYQGNEKFAFLVGGGPGILTSITESVDFSISYELLHLSNAGISDINAGYNSDCIMTGLEVKF